jgi:hypothetical protein
MSQEGAEPDIYFGTIKSPLGGLGVWLKGSKTEV